MTSTDAPDIERTGGQNEHDFVRTIEGVEFRLPSLSYLKPGLVRRIRRLSNTDAIYTLLELSLSAEALAVLDDMAPADFQRLLEEWRIHSGVSLGES
ncbi:hypothetical protein [Nocardia inohanensis]|uniref:hypothetical protein n=1 Tax=Nocardia inohanensis TaxID=209246 RepID=UPI00082A732D|nr:hypothetical protein [Nocardia inohanensis]